MRTVHHRPRRRLAAALAAPLALALAGATAGSVTATAPDDDDDDMAAAEDGLLAELQEAGTATIGIAFEPPFGYEDEDGNPTGSAPEVAKAVLAELGIDEVDAVTVEFGSLIPGLHAGEYDLIAAGMYINAERAEQIIFSDPDYCIAEAFAVEEGNPLEISDFPSIVDSEARLAVVPGTVEEGYALEAGVPEDQLEIFGEIAAQYDALEAGRVDAVPGTRATVELNTEQMDGFEATEPFFPTDADGNVILGCGGYGFLDQEFRDAFNHILRALLDDGTVAEIIGEFGFSEEEVELAAEHTVESLIAHEEETIGTDPMDDDMDDDEDMDDEDMDDDEEEMDDDEDDEEDDE